MPYESYPDPSALPAHLDDDPVAICGLPFFGFVRVDFFRPVKSKDIVTNRALETIPTIPYNQFKGDKK
jgi:hypothetical protein